MRDQRHDVPLRLVGVRLMLGEPVGADGSELVQTRRPLSADEQRHDDDGDGRTGQNEREPDGHGAIVPDSAHVRNLTATESRAVVELSDLSVTSQPIARRLCN